jgi:hypothetical protein
MAPTYVPSDSQPYNQGYYYSTNNSTSTITNAKFTPRPTPWGRGKPDTSQLAAWLLDMKSVSSILSEVEAVTGLDMELIKELDEETAADAEWPEDFVNALADAWSADDE